MAARTMDVRQIFQPIFLEGIINKKLEQNLSFKDMFPRVRTDALGFSYFSDLTTAGADIDAGKQAKPSPLMELGELDEIETSSIDMQHGQMRRFGYQLRFSQRQFREEAIIDEVNRAVDRAAFGMAKKMNDDVIAAIKGVVNDVSEFTTTTTWDQAAATPVEDVLSMVQASIIEGYPYEMNNLFLNKQNYFELLKYMQGIDINWVRNPLGGEGQNMPQVNGVNIHRIFDSELAEGAYIGMDSRFPGISVYEYLDPKHSTQEGGRVNVNIYEEERHPYNMVVEMYAEQGLAVKLPNSLYYAASAI